MTQSPGHHAVAWWVGKGRGQSRVLLFAGTAGKGTCSKRCPRHACAADTDRAQGGSAPGVWWQVTAGSRGRGAKGGRTLSAERCWGPRQDSRQHANRVFLRGLQSSGLHVVEAGSTSCTLTLHPPSHPDSMSTLQQDLPPAGPLRGRMRDRALGSWAGEAQTLSFRGSPRTPGL